MLDAAHGMMVLASVFLTGLLWLIALKLWAKFVELTADSKSPLPLPKGSAGLPFIGETVELVFKGYTFFADRRKRYGKIYRTHIMGRPTIRVFGTDNIKKILESEDVCVTMQWPTSVKKLIGYGSLMASVGELHHIRRQSIMKAFTDQAMTEYLPKVQSTVRDHLAKWRGKGTILGEQESKYLAVDLVGRCLFGYNYHQREIFTLAEAMGSIEKGLFSLPYNIPWSSLNRGLKARETCCQLFQKAVSQSMQNKEEANNLINLLLCSDDGIKLDQAELEDTLMEVLFASIAGISSAVCTLLLELARHGHSTEMASQEIFHHDLMEVQRDGDLTGEKLSNLRYVKNIIKEVLRLTPPVGGGYRKVLRTMEIDGYQLPKGWTVFYSIRDQHATESDNSRSFDPDRWQAHRDITSIDRHLYIPFGGDGQRSCIGAKFAVLCLEVMAAEVIRSCQWRLLEPNPAMKYFPVPYPSDGLPLVISEAPPFRQRRVTL